MELILRVHDGNLLEKLSFPQANEKESRISSEVYERVNAEQYGGLCGPTKSRAPFTTKRRNSVTERSAPRNTRDDNTPRTAHPKPPSPETTGTPSRARDPRTSRSSKKGEGEETQQTSSSSNYNVVASR